MTQVATPDSAIPSFDNVTVSDVHGRAMILRQRGRELWAEFDDPDSPEAPDRRPRIERHVTLITGSHNQQVFWYGTGQQRLLGQLPGAYLVAEQRWIPRRMAVLHPPSQGPLSETGHWNSTCLACHATNGKPQFDTPFGSQPLDTQSIQTTVAEFGIACEACHGPGKNHARANGSLVRRYGLHFSGAPDPTTVQPARLDPTRASQACGQCHGVWEFYDEAAERHANSNGLPYRPGDELSATRFVAQPTTNVTSPTMQALLADDARFIRDAFWSDGTVRVSGREYNGLLESPCYKNATDASHTMSCFSCHTLHKADGDPRTTADWANDQLSLLAREGAGPPGADGREPSHGNGACLQCHEPMRANPTAHTKHKADSEGSSCYNCHMPYTTYGLLKTIRSHTVGSPSVTESIETGRPNACNLCHLDRTLAWTDEALERWYGGGATAATAPEPAMAGSSARRAVVDRHRELTDNERTVAASLLWLLTGDAGQRAIISQAMAWPPAQQASGAEWMAPFVAQLLDDPYDAVRFGAARSMKTLPGFGGFTFDFVEPSPARRRAQLRSMATWDRTRPRPGGAAPELLQSPSGGVDIPRVLALLKQRNNRPMLLRE